MLGEDEEDCDSNQKPEFSLEKEKDDQEQQEPQLDWNQIRGKLYDRSDQEQELLNAFLRTCNIPLADSATNRELYLITGPSGTGKTCLANTVCKRAVEERGGYFITGKFDLIQRSTAPFAPFVHAFTQFATQVQERGDETVAKLKKQIIDKTTGSSTAILTDVVPALQELLGVSNDNDTPAGIKIKSSGAQNHFLYLFCKMVASICTPECPLVLFLDDLQWAEPASLDLLSALVRDPSIQGLLLLGACRGNEVSRDHNLSVTLRELEATGVRITNSVVENLHSSAVHQMISDVLNLTADESKPLADFVFRQTNGNIFFSLMLLRTLFEEGFLYKEDNRTIDATLLSKSPSSSSSSWKWDSEDSILMNINCQDVVNMVVDKIRSLSPQDQQVLKIGACMGAEFDEYIFTETCDCADVGQALQHAHEKGLVSSSEQRGEVFGGWRFVHDTIQQSAYSLIPEADRPAFHLEIGRKLWASLSPDDVELNIFLIVHQLSLGMDLMDDEDERYRMALLCLGAGERSTVSSAFQVAASYLNTGISLLAKAKRHWRDQYHISITLFNAAAEVEYCNANHDRTDYLVGQVLLHARCFKDKLQAYTTQIYSVGSRGEFAKAIGIGLKVLKELGYTFPSKVNTFHIVASLMKTRRMLKKNKLDQDILDLPRMVDGDHLAVARLLNILFNYTNHASPELSALVCFKNVQLTLKHGVSSMSCVALSSFGLLLSNAFGDVEGGSRYCDLSLKLMDLFKAREWLPRVYAACYGFCYVYDRPSGENMDPLLTAYRSGLGTGDFEFASLCAVMRSSIGFHTCSNLQALLNEMTSCSHIMLAHQQQANYLFIEPLLFVVRRITEEDPMQEARVAGIDISDLERYIERAREANNGLILSFALYMKFHVLALFNEYQKAHEASVELTNAHTDFFPPYVKGYLWLYEGIIALSLPKAVRRPIKRAKDCLKKMKSMAKHCEVNLTHKISLLEAEIMVARGNNHTALSKYKLAVSAAQTHGYLSDEALAWKRAAHVVKQLGRDSEANEYTASAQSCYKAWGAYSNIGRNM